MTEKIKTDDAVFFYDTIAEEKPYIAFKPRNHESLCFVTNGTLAYEHLGKTELIKEGQVGYIARGSTDKSSAYNCPKVSYIAVDFNFDKTNPAPNSALLLETVCSKSASYKYEKLFKYALDEYTSKRIGSQMICGGILQQIIGMLYNDRAYSALNAQKANKLKKSIDFLKQNYQNPDLTVKELAETANISEKHFRRLFVEIYDKNPHEFLRDFRLNTAEPLLLNTSKQISDIAVQCGFSDVYSFSHCFKKHMGISPKKYRETQYDK